MRSLLIPLAAFSLIAAGCAGADKGSEPPTAESPGETTEGWTGYAPMQDGDEAECSKAKPTPIGVGNALDALRGHGLGVRRERSTSCSEGVAAVLNNEPEDFETEGSVSCFVKVKPGVEAPTRVVRRGADGADAELALENLTCTIFTDSALGESKIDRLEAAFAELERAIRP
jgi:hypothetical protein